MTDASTNARGALGATGAARRRGTSTLAGAVLAIAAVAAATPACADAVDALRQFVRDARSGQAAFTQTVTAAEGGRTKSSSGEFEFARPNRFRFAYVKPFEQTIVADGQKVWIYDADLNQASSRRLGNALGATPAALLAGAALEPEFALTALPSADGLDWVQALPRDRQGMVRSMRVGMRGAVPVVLEVTDSFGQRSRLEFARFAVNTPIVAERFVFKPPPGADVVEQ